MHAGVIVQLAEGPVLFHRSREAPLLEFRSLNGGGRPSVAFHPYVLHLDSADT